jgi:Holliday junction resolvase RusA-like endonuclease
MAGRAPLQGPVRVVMTMRFPVPASWSKKNQAAALAGQIRPTIKPDWDNGAKLCDAINMVVFLDDKQVVDGRVIKLYSERPGLTIEVESAFIEIEEKPLSSDPRTQSFALPRITNPKQLDML